MFKLVTILFTAANLFAVQYFDIIKIMKTKRAAELFACLGHETRLKVFRVLMNAMPEGIPAGELAARLRTHDATLSFHLNHLRNGGLIESRREGRWIIYRARLQTVRQLMNFMAKDCCGGHPEFCDELAESFAEASAACCDDTGE